MKTFISSHHFISCLLLVLFADLIIETLDFITILNCYYMCWLAFWQALIKTCYVMLLKALYTAHVCQSRTQEQWTIKHDSSYWVIFFSPTLWSRDVQFRTDAYLRGTNRWIFSTLKPLLPLRRTEPVLSWRHTGHILLFIIIILFIIKSYTEYNTHKNT